MEHIQTSEGIPTKLSSCLLEDVQLTIIAPRLCIPNSVALDNYNISL